MRITPIPTPSLGSLQVVADLLSEWAQRVFALADLVLQHTGPLVAQVLFVMLVSTIFHLGTATMTGGRLKALVLYAVFAVTLLGYYVWRVTSAAAALTSTGSGGTTASGAAGAVSSLSLEVAVLVFLILSNVVMIGMVWWRRYGVGIQAVVLLVAMAYQHWGLGYATSVVSVLLALLIALVYVALSK